MSTTMVATPASTSTSSKLPLGVQNANELDNWLRLFVLFGLQLILFYAQREALQLDYYYLLFWIITSMNGIYCGFGFLSVAHEATHRLYFSNRLLNDVTGGICFAMVGLPWNGFRQYHLAHHQHTHVKTKDPKEAWSNYPFWFAALFGSHLAPLQWYCNALCNITTNPLLFLADAGCLTVAYLYYCYLLPRYLNLPASTCAVPFTVAQATANILRGFTDHYGQPEAESNPYTGPGRILLLGDYSLLEWIGCHANYHALHHYQATLPHAHYKSVFHEHLQYREDLNWAVQGGHVQVLWSLCTQKGAYGALK